MVSILEICSTSGNEYGIHGNCMFSPEMVTKYTYMPTASSFIWIFAQAIFVYITVPRAKSLLLLQNANEM